MNKIFYYEVLGKVTNIEYGNIDFEKVIIESMLTKFENWKRTHHGVGWGGVGWGWGGGVTADDDRGCYDPVDPV